MKKFNRKDHERNNNAELAKITEWLKAGPRVVLQAAVTRAHSAVMQSEHMGGSMIHDSSNAAYNWRISFGGMPGVLMQKGKDPVGLEGDNRTGEGKTSDIMRVILKRLSDDANKFDRAVWGAARIEKVSLVNPVGGRYAMFAQLDEATSERTWRTQAEMAARSAFDTWFSGGPGVNWSRHSRTTFGAGGSYD